MSDTNSSSFVEASFNYTAATQEKHQFLAESSGGREGQARDVILRHDFKVHNARELSDAATLDVEGFSIHSLESAVGDFFDPAQVRSTYYAEATELVRWVTGARRVEAFDYNIRSNPMAEAGENGAQHAVRFAHNDYTERSGPVRVRDLFPDEADELLGRRFAVINVWKPIRVVADDMPLAICDARSIRDGELLATDLEYSDRTGEIYSLAFNPEHEWFYYPRMATDEVLLLKCYDSEKDGRARFTAHSAFANPAAASDAPARESIEVRTIAFF
jgi:hypothetical protein